MPPSVEGFVVLREEPAEARQGTARTMTVWFTARSSSDTLLAISRYPARACLPPTEAHMTKLKDEGQLFKAALLAGIRYAEGRGAVEFEATDSASDKALYVYRLLVHDKLIAPMPENQVSEKAIRHRLATWYAHLPKGHTLLG